MAKAKIPKRPTRDEFVLEEIGNQLSEAFHEQSIIVLSVWGKEEPVKGQIVKMDSRTGTVHVEASEGINKVPFMDIMSVNYPREY
ncbi:YolD-like family protein [Paenibacillus sp. NEAU-GSW1]|uniref:YolD-like family protein n=1 Tax=Paenibacillus sp. NEAU-GSW1 TaxID=2682486 RepID=UPI0012E3078B|nr:YolD-like family protein [Paenibacillus sp. NEAU-GSW1]MUT68099.1 YolD-like family protein [Paenibacillus sp. NEAU-GSW1]